MTDIAAKLAEALRRCEACTTNDGVGRQAREALAAYEQALAEPVAWMYQAKRGDGSTHGPYLCWKPTHIDVMSADMGVQPIPLFAAPVAQAEQWQPIETAPTGQRVLLAGSGFAEPHIGDWGDYAKYNQPRFTHWMPLPQPPKENQP